MAELNLKQIIDRLNEEFTGDTSKLEIGRASCRERVSA